MATALLLTGFGHRPAARAVSVGTPPPPTYLQVDFVNDTDGFVTAQRGAHFWLATTVNDGSSWTLSKLTFGLELPTGSVTRESGIDSGLSFASATTGMTAGYKGSKCASPADQSGCSPAVFVTTDGGRTWRRRMTLDPSKVIDGVEMATQRIGLVIVSSCKGLGTAAGGCGFDQKIFETRDAGLSWWSVHWNLGHVSDLHWRGASDAWMATGPAPGDSDCAGSLYRTSDGGGSWTRVLRLKSECDLVSGFAGPDGWLATAQAAGCTAGGCPEKLRATGDNGKKWKLTQGTTTWTGTDGFLEAAGLVDPLHGLLTFTLGSSLDTEGGIATSSDGGKTWNRSYPCYSIEPGGASAPSSGQLWLAGSWVSYCSQPRGTGLFESGDWGLAWKQVTTGL